MGLLKVQNLLVHKLASLYTYLMKKDFGSIGAKSKIYFPFKSANANEVYIGEKCTILSGGWIECVPEYGGVRYSPRIDIGTETYIGHNAHIIACSHMKIGKDVVIADNVYITDNLHGFDDINKSIMVQPLTHPGPVVIEDEAWLGERVCILPNVTIGKHSIIGSNSVVTKNIPPFSIAVGIPAKVIKTYNPDSGIWQTV